MAVGTFKIDDMMAAIEKFERPLLPQTLLLPPNMRRSLEATIANAGAAEVNPITAGYRQSFMGLGVEVTDIPARTVYDWSDCRSPARAQRRLKKGFPQRVKITQEEVAYLIDKAAMRRFSDDWERRCIKMLIG